MCLKFETSNKRRKLKMNELGGVTTFENNLIVYGIENKNNLNCLIRSIVVYAWKKTMKKQFVWIDLITKHHHGWFNGSLY